MPKHFQYIPITGQSAYALATVLANSIRARIRSGLDVNDSPAPPLAVHQRLHRGERVSYYGADRGYGAQKARKGLRPIRDWTYSGNTLRSLVPMYDGSGRIVVGFSNPKAAQKAAINNARCVQFGASPSDREAVLIALDRIKNQFIRIAPGARPGVPLLGASTI